MFLKILAGPLPYTLFGVGAHHVQNCRLFKGRGPQRPTYTLFGGMPYSSNYGSLQLQRMSTPFELTPWCTTLSFFAEVHYIVRTLNDSSKVILLLTLWLHIFLQRHCWHMTANEKRIYSVPALYSYLYIRRIRNIKKKNRGLSDMYISRPFLFVMYHEITFDNLYNKL